MQEDQELFQAFKVFDEKVLSARMSGETVAFLRGVHMAIWLVQNGLLNTAAYSGDPGMKEAASYLTKFFREALNLAAKAEPRSVVVFRDGVPPLHVKAEVTEMMKSLLDMERERG